MNNAIAIHANQQAIQKYLKTFLGLSLAYNCGFVKSFFKSIDLCSFFKPLMSKTTGAANSIRMIRQHLDNIPNVELPPVHGFAQ